MTFDEHELNANLAAVRKSYEKARAKHAPMRGPHEGYAVLLEEVDELWDEVKRWQPDVENKEAMRKEALHVAAMALSFLIEVTPASTSLQGKVPPNQPEWMEGPD